MTRTLIVFALLVAACGGGGGSEASVPCSEVFADGATTLAEWAEEPVECDGETVLSVTVTYEEGFPVVSNDFGHGCVGRPWKTDGKYELGECA